MGKDSVQISAAATLLADAHRHVQDPLTKSRAEDADEPQRVAKHYMQHIINSANMEIEATQAAGIVLGMQSASGSHAPSFHGAWEVVALARVACGAESTTEGLLKMRAENEGLAMIKGEDEDAELEAEQEEEAEEEKEEEEEEDYDGDDSGDDDGDEDFIASAFEQPASETQESRQWVVAQTVTAIRANQVRAARMRGSVVEGGEEEPSDGMSDGDGESVGGMSVEREDDEGGEEEPSDGMSDGDGESVGGMSVELEDDEGGEEERDEEVGDPAIVASGPEALDHVEQINLEKHFHRDGGGKQGSGMAYYDDEGAMYILCHGHHYAWRDRALESFNAVEFTQMFDVRKMTEQDRVWFCARAVRIVAMIIMFISRLRVVRRENRRRLSLGMDVVGLFERAPPQPLTVDNALGRRVLVPREIWPEDVCKEHVVLGSRWKKVAGEKPAAGNELICSRLSSALQEKLVFGYKEVAGFALEDLRVDSFVKVGSDYFEQAGEGAGWEAIVKRVYRQKRAALVSFRFARTENGQAYKNVCLELAKLRPLHNLPSPALCGRPVFRYVLQEPHPLAHSHIIIRRAKWGLPALAGQPPPSMRPGGSSQARRRRKSKFAEYFVSNLVPWYVQAGTWPVPFLPLAFRIPCMRVEGPLPMGWPQNQLDPSRFAGRRGTHRDSHLRAGKGTSRNWRRMPVFAVRASVVLRARRSTTTLRGSPPGASASSPPRGSQTSRT